MAAQGLYEFRETSGTSKSHFASRLPRTVKPYVFEEKGAVLKNSNQQLAVLINK